MRWIFWFLLAVNIVVFVVVWLQQRVVSDEPVAVAPAQVFGDGIKRLELLPVVASIQDNKEELLGKPDVESVVSIPELNGAEAMCSLVGPFKELLQAEYLVENTRALGVEGEIRYVQVPGEMTYWVYLAPEISRKAALKRLHELQAKGLDSYVIPKGELENGISFGMFSRQQLAENLKDSLQAQGYPVELKEVAKMRSETWVVFSAHNAGLLDNKTWQNLLKGTSEVERRQNYCSTVAPE